MRLLREAEASTLLGVSHVTMWRMRRDGSGPPVVRAGKQVRYPEADLISWIAAGGKR